MFLDNNMFVHLARRMSQDDHCTSMFMIASRFRYLEIILVLSAWVPVDLRAIEMLLFNIINETYL